MAISSVAEFGKIVLCSFMTPLSLSKLGQNYLTKNRITTKKGNFDRPQYLNGLLSLN